MSKFMSYEEAQKNIKVNEFQSGREYKAFVRKQKDSRLPLNPDQHYKNTGWSSWADYLSKHVNTSFESLRTLVQNQNIRTMDDYNNWRTANAQNYVIPAEPHRTYKEQWIGWNHFVNQTASDKKLSKYVTYDAAKTILKNEQLTSIEQFNDWIKIHRNDFSNGSRIPTAPHKIYHEQWSDWSEFLGYNNTAALHKIFMPYEQLQTLLQSENVKTSTQYEQWVKDNAHRYATQGSYIPVAPHKTYKDVWQSWGAFLNTYNKWNLQNIAAFAKSLTQPGVIESLSPSELYMIIQKGGFLKAIEKLDESNQLRKHIFDKLHGNASTFDVNELQNLELLISNADIDDADGIDDSFMDDSINTLPTLTPNQLIESVDIAIDITKMISSSDDDTINFIISKRKGLLWSHILNIPNESQLEIEIDKIINCPAGEFANKLKSEFLNEYHNAKNLKIPEGYCYPYKPTLMQKLVAYRTIMHERTACWSSAGAGKSLASILASRTIDAKITVIVGLNATMRDNESGWAKEINASFSDCNVIIKETQNIIFDENKPNYLILNYEKFQLPSTSALISELLQYKIDMIILDEIHFTKMNSKSNETTRRIALSNLIYHADKNNPNLRVLGMTSTPSVNTIGESVSLIEMITGKECNVSSAQTISNALIVHEQIASLGVRFRQTYDSIKLEQRIVPIDGPKELAVKLNKSQTSSVADWDKILIDYKMPTILSEVSKGTIIYSHYVGGIFNKIKNELTKHGFACGIFNGENKTGLDKFLNQEIDVLIASSSLTTGVDMLQKVSNKIIVASLPWHNANFEQLVGRIYRQGSNFDSVEIVIPQVVLSNNDDSWSYDQWRWDKIAYKKTIADAIVDGIIPNSKILSESELLKLSKDSLVKWISRLEEGDIIESNAIPFVPDELPEVTREYILSKFSEMNKNMNTSKSETTNNKFNENPDEFYEYHRLYEQASSDWVEMPYIKIANDINKLDSNLIIADLGCGMNKLKDLVPNKVYAFDHISVDGSIACDIKRVPLDDNSVDVAVFSLSLMGTNWVDYIEEASRILKSDSYILIAESHERSQKNKDMIIETLSKSGFNMLQQYPKTSDDGRFDYWYSHKSPL